MVKKANVFTIILAGVLFYYNSWAQIQQVNALFEHLTFENGLSSNEVNCLYQDSRGFIWIGTASGLNRYDGVEIVKYYHNPNANSLPGNYITSIREDKLHNFWIGTDNGISYFEPERNRFTNYLHKPSDKEQLNASIFYAGTDSDDNLWVSSNFHLSLFNKEKKTFTHYKIDYGEKLYVTRNYNIRSVFEDSKKRLWIPTSYGIRLFNRNIGKTTGFQFEEKEIALPENYVVCIRETAGKKIIASTWGGGILLFNENENRFEKMLLYEEPLSRRNMINIILDILPDKNKLYCATNEGLVILDEKNLMPGVCKQFTLYSKFKKESQSPKSNIAKAILKDNTGTWWIAANGVSKIDPLKQKFNNNYLSYNGLPLQISGISINNDELILGAKDCFSYAGDKLKPFGLTSKMKSYWGEQVWDVCTGQDFVWLATTNGLIQTTKEGVFVKQFIFSNNNPNSIAGERIWKVYEDSKGLVWAGSVRRGLSVLNPVNGNINNYFTDKDSVYSLFNRYISTFYEDSLSNIWFTAGGSYIYCYNRQTRDFTVSKLRLNDSTEIPSEPVIVGEKKETSLFIASRLGLLEFTPKTKSLAIIAYHADLSNLHDAIKDARGNYWFTTSNGLLHYNPVTKKFKRYTTRDGLPGNEDMGKMRLLPDGKIVVAGFGVLINFNPDEIGNNKNIPPVYITRILANSKDTVHSIQKIKLPYLSGIEFHFAALGFTNAGQNQYMYRLIGIEKNWSQPSQQRSVSYAQLPPGNYTFEVMGSNEDGAWNQVPATFSFQISRPYYKTWWFYSLLALGAGLIIYSFYSFRLRKAVELEQMRTRIATDLHDDIGATLSSISMYSDALKMQVRDKLPELEPVLTKMGENSRDMVTSMGDIVWAINPENDSGDKLAKRMESYAADITAAKKIQLHFSSDEKFTELKLSLEKRKNIFLIFKEAVNNAVKYSNANNLWVKINSGPEFKMYIKDDGNGFDENAIKKGNGLKNFRIRAGEINGDVIINSAPGKGTEIILICAV